MIRIIKNPTYESAWEGTRNNFRVAKEVKSQGEPGADLMFSNPHLLCLLILLP